jgi:hypothetical protein
VDRKGGPPQPALGRPAGVGIGMFYCTHWLSCERFENLTKPEKQEHSGRREAEWPARNAPGSE